MAIVRVLTGHRLASQAVGIRTLSTTQHRLSTAPTPADQHGITSGTQQTSNEVKKSRKDGFNGGQASSAGKLRPEDQPGIRPGYNKTFSRFDLSDRVILVTGGNQGLGLAMAVGCAEAGARVYCLDLSESPSQYFLDASKDLQPYNGGRLNYRQVNITDTQALDENITAIADEHQRLDGVIAAAGIQKISPAIEYSVDDARKMLDVNFTGVLMTATATARQMIKYKCQGSIVIVASMSGMIANKGLLSPVYNASKAACIQLARSLSMEWAKQQSDGVGGIRVNALSPGHIVTPMVQKNFTEVSGLRETWEAENMMSRLSEPEEFAAAGVFLLSKASTFMTGNNLVIDGGHTAW